METKINTVNTINYVLPWGAYKTREKRTTDSFNKSIEEMQSGKTFRLKNTKNPIEEILQ